MKKKLMWKVAALLLAVAVFAALYQLVTREGLTDPPPDLTNYTGMVVFTRAGCTFCEKMKEVIAELKSTYPDKFKEYDCSDRDTNPATEEAMTKYKVGGFPTIYMFTNGVPKEYLGDRTVKEMGDAIANMA